MKKIQKTSNIYCGVDCSKAELVAFLEGWKKVRTYLNNEDGINQLIKDLQSYRKKVNVICESSGGYERKLLYSLYQANIEVAHINPRLSYHFAKSEGILAKTDPIDAEMLMRFGKEKRPHPWKPRQAQLEHLRALVLRRSQLNDILRKEKNHLENALPETIFGIQESIAYLALQIKDMDKIIKSIIYENEHLKELYQRLLQVSGLGPVSTTTLIALLPELGCISDKKISALAGLAPVNDDSGDSSKLRHIKAGRSHIRESLFMAAKTASRHNPIMKTFYHRLKSAGKPTKVAYIALMRKLLILANKIAANPNFIPAS